jgi:hypothetical protein
VQKESMNKVELTVKMEGVKKWKKEKKKNKV